MRVCELVGDDMCDEIGIVIVLESTAMTRHQLLYLWLRWLGEAVHPNTHTPEDGARLLTPSSRLHLLCCRELLPCHAIAKFPDLVLEIGTKCLLLRLRLASLSAPMWALLKLRSEIADLPRVMNPCQYPRG